MSDKNKNDKVRLEFVARITMPGGKVIERQVDADDTIPTPDDFDTSSINGFLESFDVLEQVTSCLRQAGGSQKQDCTGHHRSLSG
jgi:hypothetical protein